MMSAFDYSTEPIALNYSNFGFLTSSVNCIWTWVAVLTTTAAVSVLAAIRAGAASSTSSQRGRIPDELSASEVCPSTAALKECPTEHSSMKSSSTSVAAASMLMRNAPRGKFSMYYNQDVSDDDYGDEEKINGCDSGSEGNDDGDVLHWVEATLKMKMEGIGLYECQDLRVLDGNVVRLWEGCRRRNPVAISCGGDVVVTW